MSYRKLSMTLRVRRERSVNHATGESPAQGDRDPPWAGSQACGPQREPGTETGGFPFWSPDSRSIGFFTPFKLKVIHTAGGPCRDIADVVLGRGGAWNRDGIIVFCPRPVGALYQIPAAGGTPQPLTSLDAARAEISHGFPQFLADGRRFLYFAASCRPGESSIRVGSLDSSTSKPLVGAETSAAYAPVFGGRPGCVLYVSHESLVAQPLDH
jgi:hypothetical protein